LAESQQVRTANKELRVGQMSKKKVEDVRVQEMLVKAVEPVMMSSVGVGKNVNLKGVKNSSNNVSSVGTTESSDDEEQGKKNMQVHSWDEDDEEETNKLKNNSLKNPDEYLSDTYLSDDIEAEMNAIQRRENTDHEIRKRMKLRERLRAQFEACKMNVQPFQHL